MLSIMVLLMSFVGEAQVHSRSVTVRAVPLVKLKRLIRKDDVQRRKARKKCRKRRLKRAERHCDGDGDGLNNGREWWLRTNSSDPDSDGDGLSDRSELLVYLTNPLKRDSDSNGIEDGDEDSDFDGTPNEDEDDGVDEGPTDEDQNDPASIPPECLPPNFDQAGNTTSFGIPAPLVGNQTRGQEWYNLICAACHAGTEKGANRPFPMLRQNINGSPMFLTSVDDAKVADLVAFLSRSQLGGQGNCTPTPTPTTSGTAAPTPLPTNTPTPMSTPTTAPCSFGSYDANGDTNDFGVPVTGNIGQGQALFALTCNGCHSAAKPGTTLTFSQTKATINAAPMNITSLSDAQIADLVAFLHAPAPESWSCPGTPTPTPTPIDDLTAGMLVYQVTCQSCHSQPSELGGSSRRRIEEAIADKPQMNSIQLSDEQFRVLVIYLGSI